MTGKNLIFIFICIFILNRVLTKNKMEKNNLKNSYDILIKEKNDVINLKNLAISESKEFLEFIYNLDIDNFIKNKNYTELFNSTFKLQENLCSFEKAFGAYSIYINIDAKNSEIVAEISIAKNELAEWISKNFTFNKKLFDIFEKIEKVLLENMCLDTDQRLLIELSMKNWKKSGIFLSEEKQKELIEINNKINNLSMDFSLNIQRDSKKNLIVKKKELTGLSEIQINKINKNENNEYIIGMDYSTYGMIMGYCKNRDLKKNLYSIFQNRGYPENIENIEKIRSLRLEKAKILGYNSYAEMQIENNMAKSVKNVENFLNKIYDSVIDKYCLNIEEIKSFAKDLILNDENFKNDANIHPWDSSYINKKFIENKFNYNSSEVEKYFVVENTIKKLTEIYSKFFEIEFKNIPTNKNLLDISDDIITLEVYMNEKVIGHIILDIFARPGKRPHPCCSTFISPKLNDNNELKELPINFIIANFNKSTKEVPAFMTHSDVVTFFHEFGHVMHGTFGATRYASQSGLSTVIDFVEIPSQLFENWMLQPDILENVSSHYITGEALPKEIIETINLLEKYEKTSFFAVQSTHAKFLLDLYKEEKSISSIEYFKELEYKKLPTISYFDRECHSEANFVHIPTYAASYYSYLWTLAYSIDLWKLIKNEGYLNSEIGKKLYNCILSKGSSEEYDIMIENFLGRPFSFDALYEYIDA